jgi:hypothetical protein
MKRTCRLRDKVTLHSLPVAATAWYPNTVSDFSTVRVCDAHSKRRGTRAIPHEPCWSPKSHAGSLPFNGVVLGVVPKPCNHSTQVRKYHHCLETHVQMCRRCSWASWKEEIFTGWTHIDLQHATKLMWQVQYCLPINKLLSRVLAASTALQQLCMSGNLCGL